MINNKSTQFDLVVRIHKDAFVSYEVIRLAEDIVYHRGVRMRIVHFRGGAYAWVPQWKDKPWSDIYSMDKKAKSDALEGCLQDISDRHSKYIWNLLAHEVANETTSRHVTIVNARIERVQK